MRSLKRKTVLPATTLVETLVALILLSITFGVGLIIYSNVIQNRLPYTQSKAHSVLQQALQESEQQKAWIDKTDQLGGFTIEQTIESYKNKPDVFIFTLKAITPKNERIHAIQKLITK